MNQRRKPILWNAGAARAILEGLAAGLMFLTALLLVSSELPDAALRSGVFFTSVLAGTVAGFRARPWEGSLFKRLIRFGLAALALGIGLPLLGLGASLGAGQPEFLSRSGTDKTLLPLMLMGSAAVYLCWRVFGLVWRRWQQMRRTRFAWSLTSSFANVIAAFVVLVMAVNLTYTLLQNYPADVQIESSSWAARLLRDLAVLVLPQLLIFWIGLAAVLLAALPPVLLFSYLSTRKLTRRIEDLAAATRCLQNGDLAARAPVSGEDEVAQLQTAFNAMADNLQNTTRALENERDKVAGLLKTRQELTATISHELRTPVAVLRAYLENNLASGASSQADLEIMLEETTQLQTMVEDLFTLAQSETNRLGLTLQPCDAAGLAHDLVRKLQPVVWKAYRVDLKYDCETGLSSICADRQRLEQILNNLVQNAVRHTPPGGLVLVQATPAGGRVRLCVRDTGEGIQPEDLPHIWERFYRGQNSRVSGSGLGLALVKDLVESMGGEAGVETLVGEGSAFWVDLPVL